MEFEEIVETHRVLGSTMRLLLLLVVEGHGTRRIIDLTTLLEQRGYPTYPSVVSLQLKLLCESGLLTATKRGNGLYYQAQPEKLLALIEHLSLLVAAL